MKKIFTQLLNKKVIISTVIVSTVIILSIFTFTSTVKAAPPNDFIVPLCRQFSKDLFDLNANPYLSPTVQVVNATSNAGFFHSAYVPRKVNKPYFRISGNLMLGSVRDDMKTFNPQIPARPFDVSDLEPFIDISNPFAIKILDTAGMINYFLQTILYQGLYLAETIPIPTASATTLGKDGAVLRLETDVMTELVKNHPLYPILVLIGAAPFVDSIIGTVPRNFVLPDGGNLNTIAAAVPQIEIGSLFGTELLIRLIPPLDLGEYIGKFSFWGIGLKHSISQYFYNDTNRDGNATKREQIAPFDLAIQAVYQSTNLENTVGITEAKLKAGANIFNINLHASKNFNNYFELHTGLSYERTDIKGTYTYYLPTELQKDIGLLRVDTLADGSEKIVKAPPEYPGDDVLQSSNVSVSSNHIKWIIGASKNIKNVTVFANYNVSKFNIFSGGIQYRF
jgi:hypothetical protein